MRIPIQTGIMVLMLLSFFNESSHAQYATRKISKKQQEYTDSLKQVEYNYIFPILGQQAYSRGI